MSLLDHPTAQALLADAEVSPAAVAGCRRRLESFLQRFLPRFYRVEQHELLRVVLQGKLSNLQRKTSEPIAYQAGRHRKPVQHFVGAGCWDDEAVLQELRRHVAEQAMDPDAVLVLDPSSFPKSGSDSCGVARQWCGRLGKVENCQVGVFLAYVSAAGSALVDRQLYLPAEWADDATRREPTHVPATVRFQESWRIGLQLLERTRLDLPCGWVAADDEFGRCGRSCGYGDCGTCWLCLATRCCATAAKPRRRAVGARRGDAWTRGPRRSRAGGGGNCGWGTGRRVPRWSGRCQRGCRPRRRAAAALGSAWWCCAR
jgi:hypothetical protein